LAISHHALFALKDQVVLASAAILFHACLEATVWQGLSTALSVMLATTVLIQQVSE
jgi:hypothetical protein